METGEYTRKDETEIMNDKFTERVRKVIYLARDEANRLQHDYIGTEHILLGIVREGEGIAARVLKKLGLNLEQVQKAIENIVRPTGGTLTLGEIPLTPRAKRILELSVEEARLLSHNYVGTEHLLLGLIREGEGVAARVLLELGVDRKKVRNEIMKLLQSSGGMGAHKESKIHRETPNLNQFGRDITKLAKENKLDPIIGREIEINRIIQILCRRKKNNPVLIGEPGVGKTAILEGLAQKIVNKETPGLLRDKRIINLDLSSVVAGTKYRGQFEERLKTIINEISNNDQIIIFIDEIHTIVGAGGAEGAIDASNMLKPALARGEIQCIGATTLDEYRKYIEKDGALERRFQSILINPPNEEETINIIMGLRDKYEAHHRTKFTKEAIAQAVYLSQRYVQGRFLPDKAIDIIDEAGSRARLSISTMPEEQIEIMEKIENITKEKESAIQAQEFEKAASFRDTEKEIKKELEDMQRKWRESRRESSSIVTDKDIATVIAEITGIPVSDVEEEETIKLLNLEDELRKRVVGQEEALEVVARAVRRNRAGLRDPKRPIGSFVFLGPTGVGKTELARTLSATLFENQDALIQIDMSEYMEKFSVSRLVGAPPGYVGYEEGGQLTEKVRRRPYSVVLLDEIEKAHPDVFNILLQIFEEGNITDSFGRRVDFKNTVIIMTSNAGVKDIKGKKGMGFVSMEDEEKSGYEHMKTKVLEATKQIFNPEFINRLDELIVFRQLNKDDLMKIIDILLRDLYSRLKTQNFKFEITKGAKEVILANGYDPTLGARPLKRAIQRLLENPLSEKLLSGEINKSEKLVISDDPEKKKLIFKNGKKVLS
ncbi:MAG: ATP-dependent Clp protease ATP-binding subunit [Candidatus Krumholzibacteriota bacterium]|nr:ATP-dependent Clp protease ATP-binding subunit [Candidatus Krumholzibacteriota bacterium]